MNCCIVIPVYKEKLDYFEEISLKQVFRILNHYPIFFVCSENFDIHYKCLKGQYLIKRFPNYYFFSIASYSQLLLSKEFYLAFHDFDYILIYQLDAFVFSDKLQKFVDMGYDYIGAPLDDKNWKDYHVGNGGFSLRNVNKIISLLEYKNEILDICPNREYFERQEDNFFGFAGASKKWDFNVPTEDIAVTFAVQSDCFNGMSRIAKFGLPFGIHHFPNWNYRFWKPVIEEYGYKLLPINDVIYKDTLEWDRRIKYNKYFVSQIEHMSDYDKEFIIHKIGFSSEQHYVLWGAGYWGRFFLNICECLNIKINLIFDSQRKEIEGFKIQYADIDKMKEIIYECNYILVIASEKFEEEMVNNAKLRGIEEKRYIKLSDFIKRWNCVCETWRKSFSAIPGVTIPITAGDLNKIIPREVKSNAKDISLY